MPRVRRRAGRRAVPALELLAATLPELRRGLTESAARTVAYELFEKLGYGAVAVTDRRSVLAFVGAGADHHRAGDRPIRPVFEALAGERPLLAPLGIRSECGHPACPLGAAAVVPLRLTDGAAGAVVAFATDASPLDEPAVGTLEELGEQLSAQLQLSELQSATQAALQAQIEPHFVFTRSTRSPRSSAPTRSAHGASSSRSRTTCGSGSRGRASSSRSRTSCGTSGATSSSSRRAS